MYHFQTKQIRKKVSGEPAVYLDSMVREMGKLPIFSALRSPDELGLQLYSDLVLFETEHGWFAGISAHSEPRLREFIKKSLIANYGESNILTYPNYSYFKVKNKNLYFAFKHKVCLFFIPSDTVQNKKMDAKQVLDELFHPKAKRITENKIYKQYQEQANDILFFATEKYASFGVKIDKEFAEISSIQHSKEIKQLSPLWIFTKANLTYNEKEVSAILTQQNRIKSKEYLNQCFRAVYQFIKPFNQ